VAVLLIKLIESHFSST